MMTPSRNTYKALGYENPEEMLLKAKIVSVIGKTIIEKNMTQAEVAQFAGLTQPEVSRILRGQFRKVTLERLFRILNKLDTEVTISLVHKQNATIVLDNVHEPIFA